MEPSSELGILGSSRSTEEITQEVKEINSDKIVDIRKLIETTNQEMSDIDLKVMALQAHL